MGLGGIAVLGALGLLLAWDSVARISARESSLGTMVPSPLTPVYVWGLQEYPCVEKPAYRSQKSDPLNSFTVVKNCLLREFPHLA